jgi:hypothetical protein
MDANILGGKASTVFNVELSEVSMRSRNVDKEDCHFDPQVGEKRLSTALANRKGEQEI